VLTLFVHGLPSYQRFIRHQLHISELELGQIAPNVFSSASLEKYFAFLWQKEGESEEYMQYYKTNSECVLFLLFLLFLFFKLFTRQNTVILLYDQFLDHWQRWNVNLPLDLTRNNFVNYTESSLKFSFSYCCDLLFSLFWHKHKLDQCYSSLVENLSGCAQAAWLPPIMCGMIQSASSHLFWSICEVILLF